jgi:predicted membrane chloride channel (bestrophin family)
MRTFRDFIAVIDSQTIIVSALAAGSTYLCQRYNLQADIPTGLIGLAVVFPIVFSINTAYKRREEALRFFASLKAHAVALYFAHRDWPPDSDGKESEHTVRFRGIVEDLLKALQDYLAKDGRTPERLQAVFAVFSRVSASHEAMREANVPSNEISRASQYLSKMITEFERMRNIATYRTPVSLRAYSVVFLNVFPIAFGPYFATLCTKSESFPAVGYLVAVLYSVVLVSLDNIQEHLEDPFDDIGTDDINLNVLDEYRDAMTLERA